MVAEVLFSGGRLESVSILAGTPSFRSDSGRYDTSYADGAIQIAHTDTVSAALYTESSGVLSGTTVVSGETLYAHFERAVYTAGNTTITNLIEFRDSSGFPWLAIRGTGSSETLSFVYNSGTGASPVWTAIGSTFIQSSTTLAVYDVTLTLGSPHSAALYFNGTLLRSGTFTQASLTNVATVRFTGVVNTTAANNTQVSQILLTRDMSTIGAKVKTIRATGAGANTGWSNSFTAVNEVGVSDATIQNATSSGLKSTHVMGDVTVPSGFEIKSVFHWLRAKNDGTGPVNIKSLLRLSGTDYATGNLSNIGLGYGPIGARYDTDPLSSNWTESVWNSIEAGYEAVT